MKSGVNIDCNYMVPVRKIMEYSELPSPRLRRPKRRILKDIDGSILPLITVTCEDIDYDKHL